MQQNTTSNGMFEPSLPPPPPPPQKKKQKSNKKHPQKEILNPPPPPPPSSPNKKGKNLFNSVEGLPNFTIKIKFTHSL